MIPNPPNHRHDRKQLDSLREKLAIVRRRYITLCWRKLSAKRRGGKIKAGLLVEGIAQMAAKMKARGLYAESTNDGDVRYSILRQFHRLDPSAPKRRHEPFAWGKWLDSVGVQIEMLRAA